VSERRKYLLLLGLIIVALAGVAYMAVPGSPGFKKPTLGLDLQGGLEVVLQAEPEKGQKLDADALNRSVDIMRNRIDKLGVSEPDVRKQGTNQIVIALAGVHDPGAAARLIGTTAKLEFYDLESDATGPSKSVNGAIVPSPNIYTLLAKVQSTLDKTGAAQWYLFDAKTKDVIAGPLPDKAALFKTKKARDLGITAASLASAKAKQKAFGLPKGNVLVSCGKGAVVCPGGQTANPTTNSWYLFKYHPQNAAGTVKYPSPELTGEGLKLSGTRADFDPTQGPVVLMQFTGKGSKAFQKITKALYDRGRVLNTPQHFAIVLDREIRSFPQIDYTDSSLSQGISGNAQITGINSFEEAKNLALVLQTGALPVNFKQIERTDVSATLGKNSLRQAWMAALVGLILVALALLILYRFLGVVAVIGLAIYAALYYAATLLLNVTLTLPGFAGAILTIGVAADANVVIFERIKEEVRAGKSVRAAISAGYAKGFHTIVDANVVTAITAIVLFAVATAGVKGFALLLLLGTVISLVTAVAATRALLGLLAGFSWFNSPRFMGATATEIPRWQRIDVVSRRRLWFIISMVAILVSVIALAVEGLNLGIDFKGGSQITFKTPAAQTVEEVGAAFESLGQGDAIVQGTGKSVDGKYLGFQVRDRALDDRQISQVKQSLSNRLGVQQEAVSVNTVSSTFSRQILSGAILAIVFSFALIALYVTIRYRWRFALPILRTLINDIPITLGVYAISGREVSTATVAAILTILGFSIYDTIIVFDRIRENIKLMPRATIAEIANISVWEVLRRSIVTTSLTLIPIVALYILGGPTLQDFAFAIIVGIVIGAVSTLFIATPSLTVLMERDPEFARRKRAAAPETRAHEDELLAEAEQAAADEPAPLTPVGALERAVSGNDSKRERRRQRRRSRPHGRAR
jgi:SecD/SecF fusion protein